jgi:2,4-dienoyl-CoA reductase (NADPH2)
MIGGATYRRIDDAGLHITLNERDDLLPADSVIICAGQESVTDLVGALQALGKSAHIIGGAKLAAELDAERAIRDGVTLASQL